MIKITSLLFAALLGLCLHAAPVQAQDVHTCVSAARGNDANTCQCSQPCRTFQAAHNQTVDRGEVTVLDPGDYGTVVITKPISIVNDGGGEASILVSPGTTGITINAPGASVNLRGLTVQGVGDGGANETGIQFNGGQSLTITNCVVRNLTADGIRFFPGAGSSGEPSLAMSDTLVADNGRNGITIFPDSGAIGAGAVRATLDRVRIYGNAFHGLAANGSNITNRVSVSVSDSVAAHNRDTGFAIFSSQGPTLLMVTRSVVANNQVGLSAFLASTLRIGQSVVTGNVTTWAGDPFGVLSYGDNDIHANLDSNPPMPIIPKQ